MSDWPPKPQNDNTNLNSSAGQQPTGQEWKILEKAVLASVEEQRRTRRWGIFFKILTFLYILFVLVALGKSCSLSGADDGTITSENHLGVVNIVGTIDSSSQGVNSTDTIKSLKKAFEAKSAKAVVLNVNSPGGSPVQSDDIWQEIQYLKKQNPEKKVYAVIGDMGASGAYYIASAADEIWVNPSSLVGSIGVIMPNYGVNGLAQKLGVEDRTMTSGSNKDILSMTKPINPEQRAHIQALLDNVHDHFIDAVKKGRGEKLKSKDPAIFSGLFWTGDQAIKLGIADKAGNIETLKRELKVKKTVNYTVERSPFDSVLGRLGSEMGNGLGEAVSQKLGMNQDVKMQ
ncbi:signal peptide peptidase SppA [Acinetobacter guillouiae]|uniref:signal peptide peptidase SppA n=1 Tax=Acinetobacter TaxID=469 RepID=UPI0002CE8B35|nr:MULTISPECIES: signal peptide peptidase SppA [Acinetobacter]ENU58262.1 signal peptide peptidase SppA, 36K type [Acinetobacter guillouiae CIP 63.46]EPH39156.1 Putative peptidase [Acinetobacter guillouiae MSP4-18]KAB0626370.1 signal peptide peptidase SppA [Acinetobacter guillouiae]MCS4297193.1 protease-4 [Acinetobacter guillouiae]MCW2250126.1 protease-4 [Acinetobacter sp. BIGb0204]